MAKTILFALLLPTAIHSLQVLPKYFCGPPLFMSAYCDAWVGGLKLGWNTFTPTFYPSTTRNWTMEDVMAPCEEYYSCVKYCLREPRTYDQKYDVCIENLYIMGPASLCDYQLRQVMYNHPGHLSECVEDYLYRNPRIGNDCEEIYEREACFYGDVKKYCEKNFVTMFEEHFANRMYLERCEEHLPQEKLKLPETD